MLLTGKTHQRADGFLRSALSALVLVLGALVVHAVAGRVFRSALSRSTRRSHRPLGPACGHRRCIPTHLGRGTAAGVALHLPRGAACIDGAAAPFRRRRKRVRSK